ncbi:MAG: hypothetical protein AAFZ07_13265 [Actinomycetota bacterium]
MNAGGWRALRYLALRRRSEWPTWLVLAVVVAVVVAVATGMLRQIDRAGEEALTAEIEATPPVERGLRLEVFDRRSPRGDPVESVSRATRDQLETAPDPVADVFDDPELIVDLTRYQVALVDAEPTAFPSFLTLRTIAGLDERISVVEGAPAEPTTDETDEELPIVEIGLSVATAEALDVGVGALLTVQPDPDDLLLRRTGTFPTDVALRVAEIVELTDPAGPEWFGDERLHRPIIDDTGTGADVFAFGFIRPDVLPLTPLRRAPYSGTRLADLRPETVTLATSDDIQRGLERFISTSATSDTSPGIVFPSTQLAELLERERTSRITAGDVLGLALAGLGALALATVLLVAEAGSRRGNRDAIVARGRGTSRPQLIALTAVEAAVVVGAGALVGAVVANVTTDAPVGAGPSIAPAVWVLLGAIAAVTAAAAVRHRPPLGEVLTARGDVDRPPARLAVAAELTIAIVAVAGWVTLRRNGIGTGDQAGWLATVAPLAVAAVIVLVVRRVPAWLARRLADRAGTGGLAVPLGLRRAEQGGTTATALVGAVVLAAVPATIGIALVDAVDRSDADEPLTDALRSSATVIVAAALLLALTAMVAIARLLVDARHRQRAMLAAMGAPPVVAARALSTELAVPGLVAAASAGLVGAVLSVQLGDRVLVETFTGRDGDTITTSWWIGLIAGLVLVVACIAGAGLGQRAGTTSDTARLLRTEEGT